MTCKHAIGKFPFLSYLLLRSPSWEIDFEPSSKIKKNLLLIKKILCNVESELNSFKIVINLSMIEYYFDLLVRMDPSKYCRLVDIEYHIIITL